MHVLTLTLPRVEAEELAEELPPGSCKIASRPPTSGKERDALLVAAALVLSREVIRAVAVYIARRQARSRTFVEVEISGPDGSTRTLRFGSDSQTALSEAEVLEALQRAVATDADPILRAAVDPKSI